MVVSDLVFLIPIILLTRNFLSRDLFVTLFHFSFSGVLLYILLACGIHETPGGFVGVIIVAYKFITLYLALSAINLINIVTRMLIRGSNNGFIHLDKVYELHVFKPKSDYQFAVRVTRGLKTARVKGYLVEFTTDHFTHGQLISMFGDAVINIKQAHPFTIVGNELYKRLFRVKRNNRRHYLTTVIDPSVLATDKTIKSISSDSEK